MSKHQLVGVDIDPLVKMNKEQFLEEQLKSVWEEIPAIKYLKYKDRADRILFELFSEAYEKGWADSNQNRATVMGLPR